MKLTHIVSLMICALVVTASPLLSQNQPPLPFVLSPQQMQSYTRQYTGERYPDGRPKVSDNLLKRMRQVTCEEAWEVLRTHGYNCQFQGQWVMTHDDPVLVGRAVTCNFIPHRPDIADAVADEGQRQGFAGRDKHWIMDRLSTGDVLVADLMDRQIGGALFGDNLANMLFQKTGTGCVVWGGARDLTGILELKNFIVFNRNWDPSTSIAYDKTMVIGYNTPIVIGRAAVMPGDVVLGLREGVIFIPAHLAQTVVETSEITRLKDAFGFERLKAGVYTSGQIDAAWTDAITKDFSQWVKTKMKDLPLEQQEVIKKQEWY